MEEEYWLYRKAYFNRETKRDNLPQGLADLSLQGNLFAQEDRPYQLGPQDQGHPTGENRVTLVWMNNSLMTLCIDVRNVTIDLDHTFLP